MHETSLLKMSVIWLPPNPMKVALATCLIYMSKQCFPTQLDTSHVSKLPCEMINRSLSVLQLEEGMKRHWSRRKGSIDFHPTITQPPCYYLPYITTWTTIKANQTADLSTSTAGKLYTHGQIRVRSELTSMNISKVWFQHYANLMKIPMHHRIFNFSWVLADEHASVHAYTNTYALTCRKTCRS